MLSGETAGGMFPIEAVTAMRRIVEEAEKNLDYLGTNLALRKSVMTYQNGRLSALDSFCSTAVKTALDMDSPLIVVFAGNGETVRCVSKYRPKACILAVTNCEALARHLNTSRGVLSYVEKAYDGKKGATNENIEGLAAKAMTHAKKLGISHLSHGSPVVVLTEEANPKAENSKILKV